MLINVTAGLLYLGIVLFFGGIVAMVWKDNDSRSEKICFTIMGTGIMIAIISIVAILLNQIILWNV
jgi:hypothetical protein